MNVLLVLGHPRTDSLCGALCAAYQEGDRRNAASGHSPAAGRLDIARWVGARRHAHQWRH